MFQISQNCSTSSKRILLIVAHHGDSPRFFSQSVIPQFQPLIGGLRLGNPPHVVELLVGHEPRSYVGRVDVVLKRTKKFG